MKMSKSSENLHPWIRVSKWIILCLHSVDGMMKSFHWKLILFEVEQWTKRHGKRWKRIRGREVENISLNDVMTVWQNCLIVIILTNYVITSTHRTVARSSENKWMDVLYCYRRTLAQQPRSLTGLSQLAKHCHIKRQLFFGQSFEKFPSLNDKSAIV